MTPDIIVTNDMPETDVVPMSATVRAAPDAPDVPLSPERINEIVTFATRREGWKMIRDEKALRLLHAIMDADPDESDLPELTAEERAAMDSLPADFIPQLIAGNRYEFEDGKARLVEGTEMLDGMAADDAASKETAWLLRMAEKEGKGIISVGGLVTRVAAEERAAREFAAPSVQADWLDNTATYFEGLAANDTTARGRLGLLTGFIRRCRDRATALRGEPVVSDNSDVIPDCTRKGDAAELLTPAPSHRSPFARPATWTVSCSRCSVPLADEAMQNVGMCDECREATAPKIDKSKWSVCDQYQEWAKEAVEDWDGVENAALMEGIREKFGQTAAQFYGPDAPRAPSASIPLETPINLAIEEMTNAARLLSVYVRQADAAHRLAIARDGLVEMLPSIRASAKAMAAMAVGGAKS